jgi:hypothetical protein
MNTISNKNQLAHVVRIEEYKDYNLLGKHIVIDFLVDDFLAKENTSFFTDSLIRSLRRDGLTKDLIIQLAMMLKLEDD